MLGTYLLNFILNSHINRCYDSEEELEISEEHPKRMLICIICT